MSLRRPLQLTLAILVTCVALAWGSAAGAVDSPGYTAPPPSQPVGTTTPQSARQITQRPAAATPSRQRLPITGSDSTQLVVIGGVLVAGGAGLLALRRRTVDA